LRFQVNPNWDSPVCHWCLELASFRGRVSAIYIRDIFGRQVLVELTYAETEEFEMSDAAPPVDERGRILGGEMRSHFRPISRGGL
jgi:hypothetical protein